MRVNLERGNTPQAIYQVDFSKTRTFNPVKEPDLPKSLTIVKPDGSIRCFEHKVVFQGEKIASVK